MDWDTYDPLLRREDYVRLLRSPLKSKGHITMDLCLPTGKMDRFVHSRATAAEVPRFYNAIRKVSWGGLVPSYMLTIGAKQPYTPTTDSKGKPASGKGKITPPTLRGKASGKKQKDVVDEELDAALQKAFDELMVDSNTFPAANTDVEVAGEEEAGRSSGRRTRRSNVRRSVRKTVSTDDE